MFCPELFQEAGLLVWSWSNVYTLCCSQTAEILQSEPGSPSGATERTIRWSVGQLGNIRGCLVFITFLSSGTGELKMEEDHNHQNDIDHLLLTVLLPSFPPNRSQWKKLEHALNFINKSRSSSSEEERKYFQNKTERGRRAETERNYLQSAKGLDARQGSVPSKVYCWQIIVILAFCDIIISGSEDRIYSQEY